MKQTINLYPDKVLLEPTRDIPKSDIKADTFSQIGSSMLEIMRSRGGVGLSANQVGLPLNMCVIEFVKSDPHIMINPRLIKTSNTSKVLPEGCLSLPNVSLKINRWEKVTVEYEDVTGETKTLEASGLLSQIIQHEIDHLKGLTMLNRVGEYHRQKAKKKLDMYKKHLGKVLKAGQ